jgi:hypothetical protein
MAEAMPAKPAERERAEGGLVVAGATSRGSGAADADKPAAVAKLEAESPPVLSKAAEPARKAKAVQDEAASAEEAKPAAQMAKAQGLLKAGKVDEARAVVRRLHERWPQMELPPELSALLPTR